MYEIEKRKTLDVKINGEFRFKMVEGFPLIPVDQKSSDFFAAFAECGEYDEDFAEYRMEYSNTTTRCAYVLYEDDDWAVLEGSYRAIFKELQSFKNRKVLKSHKYVVNYDYNGYGKPRAQKFFATKAKALKWAQANCR